MRDLEPLSGPPQRPAILHHTPAQPQPARLTQHYDTGVLDASLLLMPLMGSSDVPLRSRMSSQMYARPAHPDWVRPPALALR